MDFGRSGIDHHRRNEYNGRVRRNRSDHGLGRGGGGGRFPSESEHRRPGVQTLEDTKGKARLEGSSSEERGSFCRKEVWRAGKGSPSDQKLGRKLTEKGKRKANLYFQADSGALTKTHILGGHLKEKEKVAEYTEINARAFWPGAAKRGGFIMLRIERKTSPLNSSRVENKPDLTSIL